MLNHFELRQRKGAPGFRAAHHSDPEGETPRPRRDRIACRCTGGFHGAWETQRSPVWPVRNHRIERISDGENARPKRNLFALKPRG